VLAELHAATEARLDRGEFLLRQAAAVGETPPERKALVLDRLV